MVSMMDLKAAQKDLHSFACKGCVDGKQTRRPIPTDRGTRAMKILELVHSNICGPIKTISIGDARNFFSFNVVVQFKARLLAKGCLQVEGVDFGKTFVPVAKINTIIIIFVIGAAMGLEMHQRDIKTTFLNGKLDDEIYTEQPEGFVQKGPKHYVYKLRKSLYGLKQSKRAWYDCIHIFFV